jgi:hypothetical protein
MTKPTPTTDPHEHWCQQELHGECCGKGCDCRPAKPTYTPEQAQRGADALAVWVNPQRRIGCADQAARVVLNAALGTPTCPACGGSGVSWAHNGVRWQWSCSCTSGKGSQDVAGERQ